MHSTLTTKADDDPHDVVVVPPDAVRVAPADDELSDLLHQAARFRADAQIGAASDFPAGAMVPPVDTTFRATSVADAPVVGERRSMARRALRGFVGLLLAACIGVAAVAWKSYGDVATRQIAKLATQLVLISSLTSEKSAVSAQPEPAAVPADGTDTASAQPAPAAPTASQAVAPAAVAPSADQAQLLQSMASDLAGVRQEVEQLKASIAELRASQPQASRDVAKTSEFKPPEARPVPRPKISAAVARPAAARARKPMSAYPQPQAAVSQAVVPQAAAPYVPPQAAPPYMPRSSEPQPPTTGEALTDPELASVPRPPMPLR